jgi:hypothetical protein
LIEIERIYKFGDLIKLSISLINEIRSIIEKISKFWVNLVPNCKKLNFRDQIE